MDPFTICFSLILFITTSILFVMRIVDNRNAYRRMIRLQDRLETNRLYRPSYLDTPDEILRYETECEDIRSEMDSLRARHNIHSITTNVPF
jgi:hypothetical protein